MSLHFFDVVQMNRFYIVNSEIKNVVSELCKLNIEAKLWNYICENMSQGNEIIVVQVDIASALNCSRQHIAKTLKKLEELRLIIKIDKKHHNYVYLVNPNKVWRGNIAFRESCVSRFAKEIQNK